MKIQKDFFLFQEGFGNGRSSWDPIVILRAVGSALSDFVTESGNGEGRASVDYFGVNTWKTGNSSGHKWLVLNGAWNPGWNEVDDARKGIANLIDDLVCSNAGK